MTQKPLYVVDEIGKAVAKVSTKLLTSFQVLDPNITGIQYYYGHWNEIITTLQTKGQGDTTPYQKYPAICLIQDFVEKKSSFDLTSCDDLTVLFVASTQMELKAAERYERVFKPFLYPMYLEFFNQLLRLTSVQASALDMLTHLKIDRLFWGTKNLNGTGNTANKLHDYVDAIEVTKLNLTFSSVCT